jgi:zinc protease
MVHEDVSRFVLPNGLVLLVRRDTTAPVVGLYTHVKAGYFDEPDDRVGIAHVLEHMYFKGTPTRGVGAIARETKLAGGWLNAHTIYDHTAYVAVLPNGAFERGLDIQFDAYANSLIDAGELSRELEVIVQEARRKKDAPSAVTVESLFALLHDHHRIRRWRIGEPDDLRTFTRDMLHAFYRTWYVPSNTILSVVGHVEPEVVHAAVLARYGTLPGGEVTRDVAPQEVGSPGVRVRDLVGDIAQAQLAFGWRTPSQDHRDSPALDLAGTMLGSGRAARFYRAVRERQLAPGVSSYQYTTANLGIFVVHAETPPEKLAEAALATWREICAARHQDFRAEELVRAQRVLEARWLRRLETMDGQAAYLASWEAEGGVQLGAEYYDRLISASSGQVLEAVRAHLDPAQVSVMVYRPQHAPALPADSAEMRSWLTTAESQESVTTSATPSESHANVTRTVQPTRATAERVVHNVHVFRTAREVPVLIHARPGTPLVSIGVFMRGGTVSEPEGREGLSRLMAQLTLKGTHSRSGAEIALAAESLGGSVGVSAGLESIGWSMSVPVRQLDAALELLADVVQSPTFLPAALDTERQLAIAEVERLRDDMYRWPMRLASEAAYRGHPYARSVIGSASSLDAISADDVRQQHHRALHTGACVIGIVGDVNARDAATSVQRHFGAIAWGADSEPPVHSWPNAMRIAEDTRDKQQTALAMLFRGPSRRDPKRHTARVLAAIASGLGGRFFEELRDRRSLAYTVAAYPIERRVDGVFAAYIATTPEREEEARDGLLEQFAELCNEPVREDEIERARQYLVGTHAIAQQSGASVLSDLIDSWSFGDGLEELAEHDARVLAVTPADILELARTYFDPARRVEGVVRGRG